MVNFEIALESLDHPNWNTLQNKNKWKVIVDENSGNNLLHHIVLNGRCPTTNNVNEFNMKWLIKFALESPESFTTKNMLGIAPIDLLSTQ